jgi:hypothetical protein
VGENSATPKPSALKAGPRLAAVRSQLAEMHQRFGSQMQALEDASRQQKQALAEAIASPDVQQRARSLMRISIGMD